MSVQSISFWQQDQNYWSQQQSESQATSAQDSLINVMTSAESNLSKGLSSIANETALTRVNSQLSAAVQSALQSLGDTSLSSSSAATTSSSSPGSGSSGTSSSSDTSGSSTSPAIGTGTAPVTTSTSLSTLGIPAGGSIIVGAGANKTTYASTGSDTIGNLISAINEDFVGNAAVTASLNQNGELVITSKNDTDTITVGGVYASNIGFAVGHDTFQPTKTASNSATAPTRTSSSTASSSSGSSTSASTGSAKSTGTVSTIASLNAGSAAAILSASGASGNLVDMLA